MDEFQLDEFQRIRDFYAPVPGPDAEVRARAKARLFADGAAAAARRPGPRWGTRRGLLRIGVPAVAVGAAAIVAAGLLPGPLAGTSARTPAGADIAAGGAPGIGVFQLPAGASVGAASGSGRQVLLDAARNVVGVPAPVPGRYYVSPVVTGDFQRLGPKDDPYQFLETSDGAFWAARSPRDGSGDMVKEVSLRAATSADAAAWRKNGSPRSWPSAIEAVGVSNPTMPSDTGSWLSTTGAQPWTSGSVSFGGAQFAVGGETLTYAQLLKLPADPAALKKIMLSGPMPVGGNVVQQLLFEVPAVIQMPVTPGVRAALYEMLAGLPGVKDLGTISDIAGQQGQAISYTAGDTGCGQQSFASAAGLGMLSTFSSCTIQQILVIGSDGMPMAEELRYTELPAGANWTVPDGLFSYEIFQTPYWTSQSPPKPWTPPKPPLG
jgi:hypothetical protein